MNQALAIKQVVDKINTAIENGSYSDAEKALALLEELKQDLHVFLETGIDFKLVVDNLDDSIYITDSEGRVPYSRPPEDSFW